VAKLNLQAIKIEPLNGIENSTMLTFTSHYKNVNKLFKNHSLKAFLKSAIYKIKAPTSTLSTVIKNYI